MFSLLARLHPAPRAALVALAGVWASETAGRVFEPVAGAERHGGVETIAALSGDGLILDGFSGWLRVPASATPRLSRAFSVSVWFAPGAYPLREAPLVDARDDTAGFALGLDAEGRVFMTLRTADGWCTAVSPEPLSLMQWHSLVATWTDGSGIGLHLDGQSVAATPSDDVFLPSVGVDWLIGRSRDQARPDGAIRPEANTTVFGFIDGTLAGLSITPGTLAASEIAGAWAQETARTESPLPSRVLPSGPPGPGPFGAFTTALEYYPQWDRAWRSGPHADVVVRFEDSPCRFVFWRGTSYIPHWVTENGIWFTHEFNETWGGIPGCGEPMSDKQCRYSRVAVIESGPARAVVHWRYALTDVFYDIARADPHTGWDDWTDELYTIHPDGTAVRAITLHTSQPEQPHEWHEAIVVLGSGRTPESALEPAALTVVGSHGDPVTYSWENGPPPAQPPAPADCVIQLVNTRSRHRPFTIIRPQDQGTFGIFAKEIRRPVSMFPWWNHWPASPTASDGRYAFAADRPSHSSLSNIDWRAYDEGPGWTRKIMLTGLTERAAADLLGLARTWAHPPVVSIAGSKTPARYDPTQRAWTVETNDGGPRAIGLEIAASAESPLENPCFILLGWTGAVRVSLDGRDVDDPGVVRQHTRRTLESADRVVWIKLGTTARCRIAFHPAASE